MGKSNKTKKIRKFAKIKAVIHSKDQRIEKPADQGKNAGEKKKKDKIELREMPQVPSALFFSANENMKPPYHVLMDTNFINFSVQHKLDILKSMMECMLAKCILSDWRSAQVWVECKEELECASAGR